MYFREVADGNLREKNCEVRLSIFFLWPNRFWPFSLPDQKAHMSHYTYVVSDESAMQAIILYSVFTVLEGIVTLIIWKKIGKKIDFNEIRKNW